MKRYADGSITYEWSEMMLIDAIFCGSMSTKPLHEQAGWQRIEEIREQVKKELLRDMALELLAQRVEGAKE